MEGANMKIDEALIQQFEAAVLESCANDPEAIELAQGTVEIYRGYCDLSENKVLDMYRYEEPASRWAGKLRRFIATRKCHDML